MQRVNWYSWYSTMYASSINGTRNSKIILLHSSVFIHIIIHIKRIPSFIVRVLTDKQIHVEFNTYYQFDGISDCARDPLSLQTPHTHMYYMYKLIADWYQISRSQRFKRAFIIQNAIGYCRKINDQFQSHFRNFRGPELLLNTIHTKAVSMCLEWF